jgi:hypothetical protein
VNSPRVRLEYAGALEYLPDLTHVGDECDEVRRGSDRSPPGLFSKPS